MSKTPRHWRDATDEVQAHFALEALRERGPVVAFTAWVSADIDAKARATGAPLPWLRNRLRKALRATLGAVEWLASIEEEKAEDGKLLFHMHGAGAFGDLNRSRRKAIRVAFRHALGAWEGSAARYQTKLKLVRDAGWASYVTKRCWLARPGIRARFACAGPRSPWCLSFGGPVFTVTNGVRARAKELHQEARRIVLEARQRAKTLPSPGTTPADPVAACEAVQFAPNRAWSPRKSVATDYLDRSALPGPTTPARPTIAARSRDPPKTWGVSET